MVPYGAALARGRLYTHARADATLLQTYLATYFCLVDFTLVLQYYHYSPKPKPHGTPRTSPQTSLILPSPAPRVRSASQLPTASPLPHHAVLGRPASGPGRRRTQPPPASGHPHAITDSPIFAPPPDSVEALYAAALDVARAAERVSNRRSHSGRPRARHAATVPVADHPSDDALMESFHSELSLASASTDDDEAHRRMTQSTGALDPRGRTLARATVAGGMTPLGEQIDTLDELPDSGMLEIRPRGESRSQSRARAARGSGRRAAGVAFMGLGLLFWHAPVSTRLKQHQVGEGHVIERDATGASSLASSSSAVGGSMSGAWQPPWPQHPLPNPHQYQYTTYVTSAGDPDTAPEPSPLPGPDKPPPRQEEPIDMKQLIGRISAWCCTTLYLTSRLPQIWKNVSWRLPTIIANTPQFQRKSVEGLSILLFVFAFLGNVTYVLSIVLVPAPEGEYSHYLLRALPYLLGSGGTLMFDLTIMVQSVVYGSAHPVATSPLDARHRRSYSYGAIRRRRTHTEDGLVTSSVGLPSERRPLLHSPARATTEPWQRPAQARTTSNASQGSMSGLWMAQSTKPGAGEVGNGGDGQ